jgi:type I restriction enzyme S subunit
MGGIKNADAAAIGMPLPPLAEQQRIVGLLDEAFEGLAAAKANAEKNLQNARALFESHLQSVFTQRGPLASLSDLADEVTDGDHSPPPKAPTGVPFITISDINKRMGTIDFSNTFTVPEAYFRGLKPSKKPRVGDVLYTVTGATLGIPILVREQRDFCFQRHIGLIRPNATTDSSWLTYALRSPQVFRQATIGSTGAAQKTVSLGVLRSLQLPKVKLAEQKQIAAKLDSLSEETQRLARLYERKHAALEALKKSLLHRAFSGEL